jgi:hypothetical protein
VGFYDVTPDGKKTLLNLVAQQMSQSVSVRTNFTAALKNVEAGSCQELALLMLR